MNELLPRHDEETSELLLGPRDREVRDAVRRVVRDVIASRAAEVDRDSLFPEVGYRALVEAGLAGLLVPETYGGSGDSLIAYVAAVEEIARACGSTSAVYMTQTHCATPILLAGSEEQKRRCLPALCSGQVYGSLVVTEPDAGSDVARMRTTARREGDSYVLDGAKTFITTGDRARVMVLFASVDLSAGRDGISAFLVEGDPDGLVRSRPMKKMGIRGSSTAELAFQGCRVPASALLGEEGRGFELSMLSVVKSRMSAAAQGVGYAGAAYAAAVEWAMARGLLAGGRPEAQGLQFRLAGIRSRISAARVLLYATALAVERSDDGAIAAVSQAKALCTDLGVEVAMEAVDLLGPDGDLQRFGIERALRDAKAGQIYDGTNEVQQIIVARDIRARASGASLARPH
ncbi:MAG TPA: acyl-CoA dehydrogenase family protein [Acidimicrobiales bacterium]|jgi:alkylation response protein AidB-like acyl-CoA dehydrogenase|nr:acyl-CoA dehydrogenase family protein [Acidimicrobiales bacterium]